MSVQDTTRSVTVPAQAGPADPPLAPTPPPTAQPPVRTPQLGRDRPLTTDERHFLLGAVGVFVVLTVYILTFLLLAEYRW